MRGHPLENLNARKLSREFVSESVTGGGSAVVTVQRLYPVLPGPAPLAQRSRPAAALQVVC